MQAHRHRPAAVLTAALAASALLAALAGCAAPAAEPLVPDPDDPVAITVLVAPVYFEANYVAEAQGFYAEHGLDVTIERGTTADAALAALANGSAQLAGSSGVATITAASRGIDARIVGGISGMDEDANSGIYVGAGSGFDSPADLTGATIAINGLRNTTELLLRIAIDEDGGDSSKTQFVEIPYSAMNQSLASGQVDAIYQVSPFSSSVDGVRLENPYSADFAGAPAVAWVATSEYAEQNPAVIDAYTAAMTEAYAYANEHPDAVRAVLDEVTELSAEDLEATELIEFGMTIEPEVVGRLADAMLDYGFIDRGVELAELLREGS